MKATHDTLFTPDSSHNDFGHAEPDATPVTDHADGANWESAWIDLGGEG